DPARSSGSHPAANSDVVQAISPHYPCVEDFSLPASSEATAEMGDRRRRTIVCPTSRFVLQTLSFGPAISLHHAFWGGRWWQRLGRGRFGLALLAQAEKHVVVLLVNAAQPGFVTQDQSEGAGLVGQRAEGGGEQYAAIDGVESRLQLGFLSDHFQIDEGGFDGGGAAQAPGGGEHLVDQVLLLQGDWFVHGVVVLAHAFEVARIFASKEDRVAGGAAVAE